MKHISEVDIFTMTKGMRVRDNKNNIDGTILSIEETAPEYIEPLVQWDNGLKEILKSYPHIFIIFD